MAATRKLSELEFHKKFAVSLFNGVWKLMLKKRRTVTEDDAMLHAAHASRHHWGEVGKPTHFAVGEWQISRVYCVLGRAEPALHHARRCLDICRRHKIGDFNLAYAYEGLARASAVAGNKKDLARYKARAIACGRAIREKDDRDYFDKDVASLPR